MTETALGLSLTSSLSTAEPDAVSGDPPAIVESGSGLSSSNDVGDGFRVHLEVFEGPFDLLLGLIAKHKLDVTEVALSTVTDEFIAYIKDLGDGWDLEQTSHFLVVAATLLDLKTARLLPSAEVEDDEDLALLEARDLLFARLLQYRAYKQVGSELARQMTEAGRRHPRVVSLEQRFTSLLPEVLLGVGPEALAALAAKALATKPAAIVSTAHAHAPAVSVKEQALLMVDRLRRIRSTTFRSLINDADGTATIVARFLALLELFREGAVAFDQVQPLSDITVRWTGADDGALDLHDEFDDAGGEANAPSDAEQGSGIHPTPVAAEGSTA